jgi:hypothetical protein
VVFSPIFVSFLAAASESASTKKMALGTARYRAVKVMDSWLVRVACGALMAEAARRSSSGAASLGQRAPVG